MTMNFDDLLGWLRAHLGQQVVAAAQAEGNTTMSITGHLLHVDDREINLIDPTPGRVEVFAVGGATLVLLEGDFTAAGTADFGADRPVLVQATFGDLVITVAELPTASL